MKLQISGVALLGVTLLAGQARASNVTINFDNLGPFVIVTNQYPSVTFSSIQFGEVVETTAQNPPYKGSPPNLICTFNGGTMDCAADILLVFTAPVDNLTFNAFGNITPTNGTFAVADVYQGGASPSHTQNLTVSHTQAQDALAGCPIAAPDCIADPQALNFTGITKVLIRSNSDANGTAYDDFSFSTSSAPEPSTLLLTGLCGIVWAGRRFIARKSTR